MPKLGKEYDDVLIALIAAGHSNKDIAAHLGVQVSVIKDNIVRLLSRYRVRNRAHLVAQAYRAGLLSRPEWTKEVSDERENRNVGCVLCGHVS